METTTADLNRELILDGNSVAGILQEIFGMELTAAPTQCASCGNESEVGTLLAFTRGPGIVLRCSACENVMMRIVQGPNSTFLDIRGAVYLRLDRPRS